MRKLSVEPLTRFDALRLPVLVLGDTALRVVIVPCLLDIVGARGFHLDDFFDLVHQSVGPLFLLALPRVLATIVHRGSALGRVASIVAT